MTTRHDAFQNEELGTRMDLNKLDVYSHCVTLYAASLAGMRSLFFFVLDCPNLLHLFIQKYRSEGLSHTFLTSYIALSPFSGFLSCEETERTKKL